MEAIDTEPARKRKRRLRPGVFGLGLLVLLLAGGWWWFVRQAQHSRLTPPLIQAVQDAERVKVYMLLEQGADPNVRMDYQPEPLTWRTLLRLVQGKGPAVLSKEETLLEHAARNDQTAIVEMLLDHGANPDTHDESGETPLMTACMYRRFEIAKALLAHSAALETQDEDGNRALLLAVDSPIYITHSGPMAPSLPLVQRLLEQGTNPNAMNKKGLPPLRIALEDGHFEIAELLKKAGAKSLPEDQNYALVGAARENDTVRVKRLLSQGVNTNWRGRDGTTALMLAAQKGNAGIVRALLGRGVDMNALNGEGDTALHLAAASEHLGSHLEVVKALLAQGAHVNRTGHNGETPLMRASGERFRGYVEDIEGEQDDTRLVTLLLDHGADVKAMSDGGETAIKKAQEANRADTVALLKRAGAK